MRLRLRLRLCVLASSGAFVVLAFGAVARVIKKVPVGEVGDSDESADLVRFPHGLEQVFLLWNTKKRGKSRRTVTSFHLICAFVRPILCDHDPRTLV